LCGGSWSSARRVCALGYGFPVCGDVACERGVGVVFEVKKDGVRVLTCGEYSNAAEVADNVFMRNARATVEVWRLGSGDGAFELRAKLLVRMAPEHYDMLPLRVVLRVDCPGRRICDRCDKVVAGYAAHAYASDRFYHLDCLVDAAGTKG
jgi:hypothetical protein